MQQPTWAHDVNQSRAEKMRQQKAQRDAWAAAHGGERDQEDFEPVGRGRADIPISALIAATTGMNLGTCTSLRTGRVACHPGH